VRNRKKEKNGFDFLYLVRKLKNQLFSKLCIAQVQRICRLKEEEKIYYSVYLSSA